MYLMEVGCDIINWIYQLHCMVKQCALATAANLDVAYKAEFFLTSRMSVST